MILFFFFWFTELAGVDNGSCVGTGNQVRILPNFIHHMWFAALNGSGLAATTYGPNVVKATVGVGSARTGVQIEVTTDYPFGTQLRFNITSSAEAVSSSGAGEWRKEQATFPLLLRIPEWTTINAMRVTIGGATHKLVPDEVCPPQSRTRSPQRSQSAAQDLLLFAL